MKIPCALAALLVIARAHAQDFSLVRSEIKTSAGSSAGGLYSLSGATLTSASGQTLSGGTFIVQGTFSPLGFVAPTPVVTSIGALKLDGSLQLIWPKVATGYLLEATADVKTHSIWTILNASRETAGSFSSVTLPITPTPQIYRLRHASTLP